MLNFLPAVPESLYSSEYSDVQIRWNIRTADIVSKYIPFLGTIPPTILFSWLTFIHFLPRVRLNLPPKHFPESPDGLTDTPGFCTAPPPAVMAHT